MRTLDELRDDIDRVDEVLVRLLNERARVACEIGRIKKERGIEVYQPEREKQVLAHVRGIAAEGPLGPDAIARLFERLVEMGMDVHRSTGVTRTVLGAVGQGHPDRGLIEMLDGVHEVLRISEPYKLASRTFKPEGTVVTIGDVRIGGDEVIVMAGPCSAENEKQVRD